MFNSKLVTVLLALCLLSPAQIINPSAGSLLPVYSSGTTSTSIAATTLCSATNCPAGAYLVTTYVSETGTGCTTVGAGAVNVQLNFIDNQAVTRSSVKIPLSTGASGAESAAMVLSTSGNTFDTGTFVVNTNGSAVSGSDTIQVLSTVVACTTPGPWTGYQVRAYVLKVG